MARSRLVSPAGPGWLVSPAGPGWLASPAGPGWLAVPASADGLRPGADPGWLAGVGVTQITASGVRVWCGSRAYGGWLALRDGCPDDISSSHLSAFGIDG
jgi:hypothetical protein